MDQGVIESKVETTNELDTQDISLANQILVLIWLARASESNVPVSLPSRPTTEILGPLFKTLHIVESEIHQCRADGHAS